MLSRIQGERSVEFRVIADRQPAIAIPFTFLSWNETTDVDDLLSFDIGIMPLPDDLWSKGKCGFKAIQYSSLGIPGVVSDVGVNSVVILDGVSGYRCSSDEEWYESLIRLIDNVELRKQMGTAGRAHIESNYSVKSNVAAFTSLFA